MNIIKLAQAAAAEVLIKKVIFGGERLEEAAKCLTYSEVESVMEEILERKLTQKEKQQIMPYIEAYCETVIDFARGLIPVL